MTGKASDGAWLACAQSEISVLAIDDDENFLAVIQTALESAGYSIATAPDGASALRELARIHPKLILLDLNMPGMDGPSFRDRQLGDESLAHIPTILMTAAVKPETAAGPLFVRACLPKPIDFEKLLLLVHHYCPINDPGFAGQTRSAEHELNERDPHGLLTPMGPGNGESESKTTATTKSPRARALRSLSRA
jgi:CheY-like chemotaxis protein